MVCICCIASQYCMTCISLSVSLWNDLSDPVFDGVKPAGFKSIANSYLLACCSIFYYFPLSLRSVYRLVLWGWGLRTDECTSHSLSLVMPTSCNNNNLTETKLLCTTYSVCAGSGYTWCLGFSSARSRICLFSGEHQSTARLLYPTQYLYGMSSGTVCLMVWDWLGSSAGSMLPGWTIYTVLSNCLILCFIFSYYWLILFWLRLSDW